MMRTRLRAVLYLLLTPGLLLSGCGSGSSYTIRDAPEELRGVWETDASQYAGRKLEILEEALLIHTGEGEYDVYLILSVNSEEGDGITSYEIIHRGQDPNDLKMAVTLRRGDGSLVMDNQPLIVWRKQG